jgi:hypothetical protein
MLVSDSLSVGQLSFILRLVIQVLNYGGLFILGLIILSNAPRIAPLATHDILNRIVGKITSTKQSLKWCAGHILGRTIYPSRLVVAVILSTIFAGFGALSDVAFLGLHICTTPYAPYYDFPASIGTDLAAMDAVVATLLNGTDPDAVKVSRCDSSTLHDFGPDMYGNPLKMYVCDRWTNSTLTDRSFYQNLSSSDTDVLMNTQLRALNLTHSPPDFYLNSFYVGVGSTRTRLPTIENGILVEPHATGARAVFGVPDLPPDKSITVDKTMLIEVDMGCMELGLFTQTDLDADLDGFDIFATDWKNHYTGPEILQPTVQSYSAIVRDLIRPLFNESSKDDLGYIYAAQTDNFSNKTPLGGTVEEMAQVTSFSLLSGFVSENFRDLNSTYDTQWNVTRNCTADVYKALNVTPLDEASFKTDAQCATFDVRGSFIEDGTMYAGISRFFCAAAMQVNMASTIITTNALGAISVNYTRLQSDLNHVAANWWDIVSTNGTDNWYNYSPFERFVLSYNPAGGQTHHYIAQYLSDLSSERPQGPVSAGYVVSRLASNVMNFEAGSTDDTGMSILEDGRSPIDFNSSILPAWGGKVASALIRNQLAYNGFAAVRAPQMLVSSTGGRPAICYDLRYGAAVVPLLIAVAVTLVWSVYFIFMAAGFKGAFLVQTFYGGISPLRATLCPKWAVKDTLLAWQDVPEAHLSAVRHGNPGYAGDDKEPMAWRRATR